MNLLQLQYFQHVAKCGNLSKAAKDLMISAPSLCSTIKRLEEDLGCSLFDKSGRSIHLNENGLILLKHTDDILASLQAIKSDLKAVSDRKNLTLRLGLSSPMVWADVINKFLLTNPNVTITYDILYNDNIDSPTLRNDFDFVLAAADHFTQAGWTRRTMVADDSPMLIVYEGHPLAGRSSVRLEEVKDEPFIAHQEGTMARRYFNRLFADRGYVPNVVISCDYVLPASLIRSKYGIGITTKVGAKAEMLNHLICLSIVDPPFQCNESIFHNESRPMTPVAESFENFVVSFFKDL